MWQLAPKYHARVVFVEHRYEGQSLPNVSKDCMSYASTIQALADYARILETKLNPGNKAPVIVFGGSYGGMLSGWMRQKYPHLVAGAIAASAPIGAFPQIANNKIDWSARVLAHGLDKPYPPTKQQQQVVSKLSEDDGGAEEGLRNLRDNINNRSIVEARSDDSFDDNHCRKNLLAAWPLITYLARNGDNADFIQRSFRLCKPLSGDDANQLLEWAQGIWFDLAEGSFPYPSSYIPFALLHKKVNLPPWPMQAACWETSHLHKDWGIQFHGDMQNVRYQISYGDTGIVLDVDWDKVSVIGPIPSESVVHNSKSIIGLLTSVRDAVSIWYNITKDVPCFDVSEVAPNTKILNRRKQEKIYRFRYSSNPTNKIIDPTEVCHAEIKRVGSWEPLCCNDEINLVITEARGLGYDFFWPPSLPRGVRTYREAVRNVTSSPCPDPYDIFGYSKEPYERWSTWLDTFYGGVNMNGHSNIVFSNGLLDPWSAGGVYNESISLDDLFQSYKRDNSLVQNVTTNGDVIALIIPYGGHHTDLMYSSEDDPTCVTQAREIEDAFIAKWIRDWTVNKL
jgi:lysosomal Pro-X carboxypeptidase